MAVRKRQGQRAADRQADDVGTVQPERVDEPGQAVGVAGHAERLGGVGRAARAGRVPRDHGELVGQGVELWPPRHGPVPDVPVQEHHSGPPSHPLEGHTQATHDDGVHPGHGRTADDPSLGDFQGG